MVVHAGVSGFIGFERGRSTLCGHMIARGSVYHHTRQETQTMDFPPPPPRPDTPVSPVPSSWSSYASEPSVYSSPPPLSRSQPSPFELLLVATSYPSPLPPRDTEATHPRLFNNLPRIRDLPPPPPPKPKPKPKAVFQYTFGSKTKAEFSFGPPPQKNTDDENDEDFFYGPPPAIGMLPERSESPFNGGRHGMARCRRS
jgi:hypothetical protein